MCNLIDTVQEFSHQCLLATIGFDTAENESLKVRQIELDQTQEKSLVAPATHGVLEPRVPVPLPTQGDGKVGSEAEAPVGESHIADVVRAVLGLGVIGEGRYRGQELGILRKMFFSGRIYLKYQEIRTSANIRKKHLQILYFYTGC